MAPAFSARPSSSYPPFRAPVGQYWGQLQNVQQSAPNGQHLHWPNRRTWPLQLRAHDEMAGSVIEPSARPHLHRPHTTQQHTPQSSPAVFGFPAYMMMGASRGTSALALASAAQQQPLRSEQSTPQPTEIHLGGRQPQYQQHSATTTTPHPIGPSSYSTPHPTLQRIQSTHSTPIQGSGRIRDSMEKRQPRDAVAASALPDHLSDAGSGPTEANVTPTEAEAQPLGENGKGQGKKKTGLVCEVCGRKFSHVSNLKRHIRVHTGEKPFVCDHCGKTFANSSNRNKHVKSCQRARVGPTQDPPLTVVDTATAAEEPTIQPQPAVTPDQLAPPPDAENRALVAGADADEVDADIANTVDVYVPGRGPLQNRTFGTQTSLE